MNIKLLDEALARIDANPDEWNQANWVCGTTACLAGHVLLTGHPSLGIYDLRGIPDVGDRAARLLGLAKLAKHPIWFANNTRAALQVWRDSLAGVPVVARGADLRGADLTDADLTDADLRGADLRYANFRGADLTDADLTDADLRGADLRYANFRSADPGDANLRHALVRHADFTDADTGGTILIVQPADLFGATHAAHP